MVPKKRFSDLAGTIAGDVLVSDAERDVYATDASLYRVRPEAIVVPRTAFDIVSTVLFARANSIAITMRGAGSSTAGQAVGRGIVIDTTKYMNKVIAVDPAGYVVAEPGIAFDALNAQLAAHGVRVPCAPSSSAYATAGGMVGNNASGARSIKYGDTRAHTRTLSLVLSDGSPVTTAPLDGDGPELAAGAANPSLWGEIHRQLPGIITRESECIERYSIPLSKNSSGYALSSVLRDGVFDVAPLIVGSEGTLAAVTQISFRLSPIPRFRGTMLCFAASREKALALSVKLRALEPSALEFMDNSFLAMVARYMPTAARIPNGAEAALLVEFEEEGAVERDDKLRTAEFIAMERTKLAVHARTAVNAEESAALWKLRYAIAPLLNRRTDGRMAVPLIEDTTVPPEVLPEFISRLSVLLDAAGLAGSYAVFGHAGDGNLHVRPLMDPRSSEDRAVMKKVLRETHGLVEELGGTATGEHGDGRLRTAYLSHRFGPLYSVFREVKSLFDPDNIFNPGIIAADNAPLSDEDLKFGEAYQARALPVRIEPRTLAVIRADAERCSGCGECRTFCPSFRAGGNEMSLPRGHSNLMRETMSEAAEHGTGFYRDRAKASALYTDCLFCRRCETLCPSGIPAGFNAYALKHDIVSRTGMHREDMLFSRAGTVNRLGSMIPGLTNWAMKSRTIRSMLSVLGVSKDRVYPDFASKRPWRYDRVVGNAMSDRKIAIFHGCHGYAFDPAVVGMHIDLLTRAGAAVVVPKQKCCGLPSFTAGVSSVVQKNIGYTVKSFREYLDDGYSIITPCPSCAQMIRELWPSYASGRHADGVKRFAARLCTLDEALSPSLDAMRVKKLPVVYFTPCHERASQSAGHRERLLAAGVSLTVIDDICCGSGGTFSMKAKNKDTYTALTARLTERLTAIAPATIVSPCGMCREQLKAVSAARVVHPVEIYARALR